MNIELFPHNELAYKKLVEYLKNHQLASIDHATGTGKSFIILKYLYENRNKRILYLSPTYAINNQLVNNHMDDLGISLANFKCFDTMIYRNILKLDMDELARNYDIIILDEYHRCGAEKCIIKILKLKELILKKFQDKKLIGLTATNIRYLDNEKDMNQIIFDGNVASRLTLADAILQGILPIFEYIISYDSVLFDLKMLKNKIKKYLLYAKLEPEIKEKIVYLQRLIEGSIVNNDNISDYVKKNGKFLVFSSSIANIENDKTIISRILLDSDYNEFEIYCKKTIEENNEILNNFRNISKDVASVLYSINILNEGVHVKDVDAIFMLRTTSSPIIYLQELGRLLSFSRRNDKVVVFDFKNNIGRNKAIYQIYEEVRTRAQELLITDPDNKERYERILNEFKIIENSQIFKLFEEVKELTSRDKLINMRLNNAIEILKNNDDCYKYLAYIDIFHYQKYITLSQFIEINKLDIAKPSIFKLSIEEFEEYLGGCSNIKEKMIPDETKYFNLLIDFYDKNYRMPSITNNDEEERNLAIIILKKYVLFSDYKRKRIRELCDDSLSIIELLCYNEEYYIDCFEDDMNEIYKQIDLLLVNKIYISNNIVDLLNYINTDESNKYIKKIMNCDFINYQEIVLEDDEIDIIDEDSDSKILSSKYGVESEILFRIKSNEIINKYLKEYRECKNQKKYIFNVYQEIINYMDNNYRLPKYDDEDNNLFFKYIVFREQLIKYNYFDKLLEYEKLKIEEYYQIRKEKIMDNLKTFMKNNNGGLPILNSSIEEKKLFYDYKSIVECMTDEEKDDIRKTIENFALDRRKVVYEYITFINKNGRRPNQYISAEEKVLLDSFYRIQDLLDEQEIMMIQKCESKLNKYKESKQLYLRMLKGGE